MRFRKLQTYLNEHGYTYVYTENDDCGGIELQHRGLSYHIWEYPEPERGAQSNLLCAGRMVDYENDYEDQLLAILKTWSAGS